MQYKPHIGSVVGPTDDIHWGQVLILPHAYSVVEIYDPDGRAQSLGVALLAHVSRILEEPLASLHQIEAALSVISMTSVVSIIVLVPVGSVVYLVMKGEGGVFLKRGDALAKLLTKSGSLSGEVQLGDTIYAASKSSYAALPQRVLVQILKSVDTQKAAEALTLVLHTQGHPEGGAALLCTIGEPIQPETEPAPIMVEPPRAPLFSVVRFTSVVKKLRHIRISSLRLFVSSLPRRFVNRFRTQPKRIQFFVAVILTGLFLASVAVGIVKQQSSSRRRVAEEAVIQAKRLMDEGVALLPLNMVKGRQRLAQAKAIVDPLIDTVSQRSDEGRLLAAVKQEIDEQAMQALQQYTSPLELFYDASLVKSGGQISAMTLEETDIGIADSVTSTVYHLALPTKKATVVAGGTAFSGVTSVGLHGETLFALTPPGIHAVSLDDKKTTNAVIKKVDEWGTIISLVSYGGNIYLLDTAKSRIWKYVAVDKGFSELREYLNADTLPDLHKTTGMAIDGSVWMGTTDGKILRFTQGKENPIVVQGVEPAFAQSLYVYTNDTLKYLYVLEPRAKRVVVLEKDGLYLAQYRWEDDILPSAMVVSEQEKKILLLAAGKLYSITLR